MSANSNAGAVPSSFKLNEFKGPYWARQDSPSESAGLRLSTCAPCSVGGFELSIRYYCLNAGVR